KSLNDQLIFTIVCQTLPPRWRFVGDQDPRVCRGVAVWRRQRMQRLATLSLAEISALDVLAFNRYWLSLRGEHRLMSTESDFDPTAIPGLLPFITLEELHEDPPRVFYRVVGSEQAHFAAGDYTGKWLHELDWNLEAKRELLAQYAEIRSSKQPMFGLSHLIW